LFLIGDVKYGTEKIQNGSVLSPGKILSVGKRSYVDLQFIQLSPDAVVRINEQSEFQFDKKIVSGKEENTFLLSLGRGLFDLKKLKQEDNIKVRTPVINAGVRGTKFIMNISKEKVSSVELLEGSLSVQPSIPELELIPEEIQKSSKALISVQENLKNSETVLEPGKKIALGPKEISQYLSKSGLDKTLKLAEIISLKGKSSVSDEEKNKALALLDKTAADEKGKTAIETKIPLKAEEIQNKDLQAKMKEFEDLLKLEKKKLEDSTDKTSIVSDFNKQREKQLRKKIEQIFDLPTEVLILKNGTKVPGVIIEEGNKIIVLSPEGRKEFSRDDVDSRIELEEK
ncbi:MAG TPA: FecR family protein, partial [Leptospiraceae bacterium]|nr:FecR family protein [Leptospiraceae bacterium]